MTHSAPYGKPKCLGNNRSVMPLDVLGRTRATLMKSTSSYPLSKDMGIPSKHKSSACVDYVPALCTHRPSLLPIEWLSETLGSVIRSFNRHLFAEKLVKLGHLEEVKVVTRFP
ncbi:16706_t:CDS:2 [Funneliformis geosporum]|uniref:16706_t:CDS:1 n=1 Tax=Funneliformis geosporum TaxID=1117311 RepID=A0A9W4T0Y3_9GLOM|nr:16706_t:CDS:2 [Funneliformis geosporum]